VKITVNAHSVPPDAPGVGTHIMNVVENKLMEITKIKSLKSKLTPKAKKTT
jgi:hypothetical protein